jgi:hypothetical protein
LSTTIRDTVHSALPAEARRYDNYVAPVVTALEDRERTISEGIINAAIEEGIDREDVMETIRNLGLTEPRMQATGSESVSGGVEEAIANLTRTVDALVQAARNNGIRITL